MLGAVAALVKHWIGCGCPPGQTPFNSFPEWARVVGGVMTCCDLGNPCLPHMHIEKTRMIEAYQAGADLHKRTASNILAKPEDQVTKADRQLAKAAGFGLLYGQSAKYSLVMPPPHKVSRLTKIRLNLSANLPRSR